MKKMNYKVFKEGLKVAGLENHGFKYILDIICIHLYKRAEESLTNGYESSYKEYQERARALYDFIEAYEKPTE